MPTHTAAGLGHEPMPGKETRKKVSEKSEEKSIRGQSMKPLTSIDVLVEEEKQEGKKRKNKKKETWIRPPSHLPGTSFVFIQYNLILSMNRCTSKSRSFREFIQIFPTKKVQTTLVIPKIDTSLH